MANSTEAISAVNHWRGQCLDNFARVERAIIEAFSSHGISNANPPPKLHESAAQRTRNLASALKQSFGKNPKAAKAAARLLHWSLREKQRNSLAHGCFTVRGNGAENWSLVNETVEVKKGVAVSTKTPISAIEAVAFLEAVISERKELESALADLKNLAS